MGFEHWEVGFVKNVGWEMGLENPPFRTLFQDLLKQPDFNTSSYF